MSQNSKLSKMLISNIVVLLIGLAVGYILFSDNTGDMPSSEMSPDEKEIAYWVAPMDPDYRRDGPGKSPMGMELVPVYEGEESGGSDIGFTVSPNLLASLGVKTTSAEIVKFAPLIEATGRIAYDETRTSRVQVRTEGWVEQLIVRAVGETVEKGDLLFTLYSPDIASALAEYGQAIQSNSQRLKGLARSRLTALGLDDRTIQQAKQSGNWSEPINVYAPSSGVVTMLGVREGSLIAKNTVAFEITDPSNVWLIADVFESQADQLKLGQIAQIKGPNYEGQATVDYIYPELDPMLQTLRVRFNIANGEGTIKSGQYYRASIAPDASEVLTVPDSAVIRLGTGNHVIVAHGDGHFEAAEVITGQSSDGLTVIQKGLKVGERVVVSGQFMLDSESSFTGASLRMATGSKMEGL